MRSMARSRSLVAWICLSTASMSLQVKLLRRLPAPHSASFEHHVIGDQADPAEIGALEPLVIHLLMRRGVVGGPAGKRAGAVDLVLAFGERVAQRVGEGLQRFRTVDLITERRHRRADRARTMTIR